PQPVIPKATGGAGVKVVLAPRITMFTPTAGKAGTKVRIIGANLAGASWVTFGGVKAHFTVSSATQIVGVVPKHAHSGKIKVHTSGGNGESTLGFRVIKTAGL